MKLINNFATKSSLTGRWVGISAENWRISGEIVTKNIKCCHQTGNRGGHFVFWDIEPEMLGHNPAEVPGHRPVILLLCADYHCCRSVRFVLLVWLFVGLFCGLDLGLCADYHCWQSVHFVLLVWLFV